MVMNTTMAVCRLPFGVLHQMVPKMRQAGGLHGCYLLCRVSKVTWFYGFWVVALCRVIKSLLILRLYPFAYLNTFSILRKYDTNTKHRGAPFCEYKRSKEAVQNEQQEPAGDRSFCLARPAPPHCPLLSLQYAEIYDPKLGFFVCLFGVVFFFFR